MSLWELKWGEFAATGGWEVIGGEVEVVGVALRSPDIVFAGALAPFL